MDHMKIYKNDKKIAFFNFLKARHFFLPFKIDIKTTLYINKLRKKETELTRYFSDIICQSDWAKWLYMDYFTWKLVTEYWQFSREPNQALLFKEISQTTCCNITSI
jgi:hypothetical protein